MRIKYILNILLQGIPAIPAAFFLSSCHSSEPALPSDLRLQIAFTNPTQSVKIPLQLQPLRSDSTKVCMWVARTSESSDVLDYREKDVLRSSMKDTVTLGQDAVMEMTSLVFFSETALPAYFGEYKGESYAVDVVRRDVRKSFVVFGKIMEPEPIARALRVCQELFNDHYQVIDWHSGYSEILLKHVDVKGSQRSLRLSGKDGEFTIRRDSLTNILSQEDFLSSWRIFENAGIWKLKSDSTYKVKYPDQYILTARRNTAVCEWVVYTPTKLSDRRYLEIITALESLQGKYLAP